MGHVFTHPPAERAGSEIHPSGDVGVRPLAVEGAGEGYVEAFEDRPGSSGVCFASGHSGEAGEELIYHARILDLCEKDVEDVMMIMMEMLAVIVRRWCLGEPVKDSIPGDDWGSERNTG